MNSSSASAVQKAENLTVPQVFKLISSSKNVDTLLKKTEHLIPAEIAATIRKDYKNDLQTKFSANPVNNTTLQLSFDGTSVFFEVVDLKTHTYKINGKVYQSDRKLSVAESISKIKSYLPEKTGHFRYQDILIPRADAFWFLLGLAALALFTVATAVDEVRICMSADSEFKECDKNPQGSAAFERLAPSMWKLGRRRGPISRVLLPAGDLTGNYCEADAKKFENCMQARALRLTPADLSQLSPDVRAMADDLRRSTSPQPLQAPAGAAN